MIASARMYAVAPGAAEAWRRMFDAVAARSGVALDYIEHAFPAPLAALWSRPDLGAAFMCGWPYALGDPARPIVAAPVPDADWAEGRPVYHSVFLVRADAPARTVADTFGGRFAFNAVSSHSGYDLPRAALAPHAGRAPLFSELVGPLTTVRRTVEAVADGHADVTAVDSFALLLLRRHDPALAAAVREVGRSASSPIPPVVGAPGMDADDVLRLRAAFVGLHGSLLHDVCVSRFVPVTPESYHATLEPERMAVAAGYPTIR